MLEDLFEAIVDYAVDLFFKPLFYWPGWLLLKVGTLGRYPPPQDRPHRRGRDALFGFVVCLGLVVIWLVRGDRAA